MHATNLHFRLLPKTWVRNNNRNAMEAASGGMTKNEGAGGQAEDVGTSSGDELMLIITKIDTSF